MKWEEVRRLYPNQYVKIKILSSHRKDNREYVDDIAVEGVITSSAEATSELMKSRGDTLVYHTRNERIVLEVRSRPGLRGAI